MNAIVEPLKKYIKDAAASAPPLVVHVDSSKPQIFCALVFLNGPRCLAKCTLKLTVIAMHGDCMLVSTATGTNTIHE